MEEKIYLKVTQSIYTKFQLWIYFKRNNLKKVFKTISKNICKVN